MSKLTPKQFLFRYVFLLKHQASHTHIKQQEYFIFRFLDSRRYDERLYGLWKWESFFKYKETTIKKTKTEFKGKVKIVPRYEVYGRVEV
jgi:hypothetical protein